MNLAHKYDTYMNLVMEHPLVHLRTKAQHQKALKKIEALMESCHADKGALAYIETLSVLIEAYEREHFTLATDGGTSPKDMLVYLMELQGLTQMDLAHELGGQSTVSKILSGARELNLGQIRALSKRFKVSPMLFMGE